MAEDKDNKAVLLARWRSAPSVDDQPSAVVDSWLLLQLPSEDHDGYDFRVVGRKSNGGWRVTTPLVALDLGTMTATTQSGRHYRLDGPMADVYAPPDIVADVIWSWLGGTAYRISDVGIAMPEDAAVALAPATGPRM